VKSSKPKLYRPNLGCVMVIVLTAVAISLIICWFDQA
jgi:hypothetical protein